MLNLRTPFPMMSGIFNDGLVEDEKRKLQKRLEELIGRRGGEADMPGVSASMSITREPLVDVGEPPPPDPNWQMEMIKRSMARPEMQPSYVTGAETYPARSPAIPNANNPAVPDPSGLPSDLISRALPESVPAPVSAGAPPTMIVRNNKNRPTGVMGGGDSLERNQALLEAQQGHKAPRSTKDAILTAIFGFINGGLPGLARNELGYQLDQKTRNQFAIGRDMAETKNNVQQELIRRKQTNELLDDKSLRAYRDAQTQDLMRRPEKDASQVAEQERDNIRQLYNSQPYFDAVKNPQHKVMAERAAKLGIVLPDRDEKDNWSLEKVNGEIKRVSKTTGEVVDTGLINRADVPVTEDGLDVTPGQALLSRSTRENRDYQRGEKQSENATKRTAKLREAETLQSNAAIYDNNADEAEKEAATAEFEVQKSSAYARASQLRQEAQQLRRQAAAARADADAIPESTPIRRTQSRKPKSDPLGLFQ